MIIPDSIFEVGILQTAYSLEISGKRLQNLSPSIRIGFLARGSQLENIADIVEPLLDYGYLETSSVTVCA